MGDSFHLDKTMFSPFIFFFAFYALIQFYVMSSAVIYRLKNNNLNSTLDNLCWN